MNYQIKYNFYRCKSQIVFYFIKNILKIMSIKENFAVSILDFDKITDMNNIILKYADITMQSSSYLIFDKQPLNTNEPLKISLFSN